MAGFFLLKYPKQFHISNFNFMEKLITISFSVGKYFSKYIEK